MEQYWDYELMKLDKYLLLAVSNYLWLLKNSDKFNTKEYKLKLKVMQEFRNQHKDLFDDSIKRINTPIDLSVESVKPNSSIDLDYSKSLIQVSDLSVNEPIPAPKEKNSKPKSEDGVLGQEIVYTYDRKKELARLLGTDDPIKQLKRMKAMLNVNYGSHNLFKLSADKSRLRIFTGDYSPDVDPDKFLTEWYKDASRKYPNAFKYPEFDENDGIVLKDIADPLYARADVTVYGDGRVVKRSGTLRNPIYTSRDKIERLNIYNKGGMIKKFQQGGNATQLQQLMMLMFAIDLGYAMGALNDQDAYQNGVKMAQLIGNEGTLKLVLIWIAAELLQPGQGRGRQALAETLQLMQALSAKKGTKLLYILRLNGECPEGYEVESYGFGGCVKCKRGKLLRQLYLLSQEGGGKTRIKKGEDGLNRIILLGFREKRDAKERAEREKLKKEGKYDLYYADGGHHTVDTKNGVTRHTAEYSDSGEFYESYEGQDKSNGGYRKPNKKERRELLYESGKNKADSLENRYFNGPKKKKCEGHIKKLVSKHYNGGVLYLNYSELPDTSYYLYPTNVGQFGTYTPEKRTMYDFMRRINKALAQKKPMYDNMNKTNNDNLGTKTFIPPKRPAYDYMAKIRKPLTQLLLRVLDGRNFITQDSINLHPLVLY